MAKLDVAGLAYLCFLDNCNSFVGRLITLDRHQYSIQGQDHECDNSHDGGVGNHTCHQDGVDEHTCCFDDTAQMINLIVSRVDDLSDDVIIPHVVKSGGDNCSLTSQGVEFITDELVVGEKAVAMAKKFISPELSEADCVVCIGPMSISYPVSTN